MERSSVVIFQKLGEVKRKKLSTIRGTDVVGLQIQRGDKGFRPFPVLLRFMAFVALMYGGAAVQPEFVGLLNEETYHRACPLTWGLLTESGSIPVHRPSESLLAFMTKHYGLAAPIWQTTHYVVYPGKVTSPSTHLCRP